MPLPKRRHSKTRGRKRRTHWKASAGQMAACPQCKSLKLAHRVCPVCGQYGGRQAVEIEAPEEEKKA
ncbi:MAG: 50S ribosomal protein L32 [Deltaproteobacteria bacterium]